MATRRYDPTAPNASYYSTRYSERKRQAEKAADAAAGPRPCLRCPTECVKGSLFCASHAAEYAAMCATGDIAKCVAFVQRTYWPEPIFRKR